MPRSFGSGIVGGGFMGRVHSVHGQYLQDWLADAGTVNWRVDAELGGHSRAFGDIGIHWCDLAEFVAGGRIVRLVTQTATVLDWVSATGSATEDVAQVLFENDAGVSGAFVVSQVSWGNKNSLPLAVDGTGGLLMFGREDPDHLWRGNGAGWQRRARGVQPVPAFERHDQLLAGHQVGCQGCFNAFVADMYQATVGDPPEGLPSFKGGLRPTHLVDAVLESAKTGNWVEVLD